jgi:S-adenosylmethionine-diacylglycerol 3-amino-3-carboxypropyl transferase
MAQTSAIARTAAAHELKSAVHHNPVASGAGALERLFTFAFSGLVYPQIWEDPQVDLAAMELARNHRVITIASGGCNVLSYLVRRPHSIIAVDLNPAHIALTRLKLAAARHLPYQAFHSFFADACSLGNPAIYTSFLRPHLDEETRRYWDAWTLTGRRRIQLFARNFYRYGLLGRFIGSAHLLAKLYRRNPSLLLAAATIEEQRALFERHLAPLFRKKLVRWLTGRRLSLYGLGIPPEQYTKLAGSSCMADVLSDRLRKLACDFPVADNYFAWQAFARAYGPALPPYLQRGNFAAIGEGASRVTTVKAAFTDYLRQEPAASIDRYVLLDAQDWMNDRQLNQLWAEITRTAKPGARVIFRTAGDASILPGRVGPDILSRWDYQEHRSRELFAHDRSAVYGGFHLYSFGGVQNDA